MTKRTFAVIAPNSNLLNGDKISKRKQQKSRNGCHTCKLKRRKCDEAKPSCQQCIGQNVSCGGYQKGLKWKPVKNLDNSNITGDDFVDDGPKVVPPTRHPFLSDVPHRLVEDDPATSTQNSDAGFPYAEIPHTSASFPLNCPLSPSRTNVVQHAILGLEPSILVAFDTSTECSFEINDVEILNRVQLNVDIVPDHPLDQSPKYVEIERPSSAVTQAASFRNHRSPQVSMFTDATPEPHSELEWHIEDDVATFDSTIAGTDQGLMEASQWSSLCNSGIAYLASPLEHARQSFDSSAKTYTLPLDHQLYGLGNTPEMIETIFNLQTSKILSIKNHWTKSPWQTLIWPLAHDCPALYHALAAMACLHLGKKQPQLRSQGIIHIECGIQALRGLNDKESMSLEAGLAARLALGFAESWDHQRSLTGSAHINAAMVLVRQAVSRHMVSQLSDGELSRLSFLANTWIYMDVLARFTSTDDVGPADYEFMTTCSLLSPIPYENQIDPLMGCAITLFPMIGSLANLVSRARRAEKGNSLDVVSKATELRRAIERWTPPINFKVSDDLQSSISDSIQTAEAYKWASLLLLHQTVPEIPWSHAMGELAQKTLVFLATIPLESPTTIVQIFPLMLAGCEACEKEDRDWVRQRWELMSKFMITGIVDRCQEVTTEVWRRRDEFKVHHGLGHTLGDGYRSPPTTAKTLSDIGPYSAVSATGMGAQTSIGLGSPLRLTDFPNSLAFKKGVDPLTRAGYTNYTVKGDLHWLGVMKDWGWQVMLG